MNDELAIKVGGVSKNFKLPHEKTNSLKSSFLQRIKGGKKKYEVQHALKDISFEVKKGEFFGIVGRNGSGKSTLLKILAEIYKPTKGSIKVNGKLVPFIELGVGFNPELTGKDNVYLSASLLGFSRKEISDMYEDIVQFAELEKFMDQKLKNYSSGMQVRLAFSIATRSKADILLIDEVLAVGDANFQRKCYDYFKALKKQGTTVVFVTHDMSAVREYCDKAVLIEEGVVTQAGNVDSVADSYLRLFQQNVFSGDQGGRWGSGQVKIQKVDFAVKKDKIVLSAHLKAAKDAADFRFGYLFRDADGRDVAGGNTINALNGSTKSLSLKKGQKLTLNFEMPNILGNGSYWLDVTSMGNDDVVYDKWERYTKIENFNDTVYYPTVAPANLEVISEK